MSFQFDVLVETHDAIQTWQSSLSGHFSLKSLKYFSPYDVVLKIGIGSVHEFKTRHTVQLSETQHIRLSPQFCEFVK